MAVKTKIEKSPVTEAVRYQNTTQFIVGMEKPAFEAATHGILSDAREKLFAKHSETFLVQTSHQTVQANPLTPPDFNPYERYIVEMIVSPLEELKTLATVIKYGPILDAEQVAKLGVNHREAAINRLVAILGAL